MNNSITIKIISISILFLFFLCSCAERKNEFEMYESKIILRDTIPSEVIEVPGVYIFNFQTRVSDSLEEQRTFFQVEGFQQYKMATSKLNRLFSLLKFETDSLISINTDRFVAKLNSSQVAILKNNVGIGNIEKEYIIKINTNIPATIPMDEEKICWGTTRVSSGIKSNGKYQKKVWILDSGVDPNHEDLKVNKLLSRSFYPGTEYFNVTGTGNDHGTQVAGIISAASNSKGIVGVAPMAEIVAVKLIHNNTFRQSSYLNALSYVNSNASIGDVANISFQGTPGSPAELLLINEMARKGIKVVISAGNSSRDVDHDDIYPAKINGANIFTVSAFSEGDVFTEFSNYGSSVDVSAPGQSILVTLPGNNYGLNSGTSFSAPFISGLLVLKNKYSFDGRVKEDPDSKVDSVGHE